MKILITGGAGFIGSHLADFLLCKRHKVVIIDNFSVGKKEFISHNINNPSFRFLSFDLLDYRKLLDAWPTNIDMVFHLAANSDISQGASKTRIDFDNTTVVTFNLLNAMLAKKVKNIFYTSGSGVYGDLGRKKIRESHGPLMPVSLYGATKLSAEALISAYAHLFNFRAWIVRPANIIGPRATHGVIYDFMRQLRKHPNHLKVLGDGKQSKSYLYISDVLQAIDLIWHKSNDSFNLFNLGSDTSIRVNTIANIVIAGMNLRNVTLKRTGGYGGWKGDVPVVRLHNSKLMKLGWKPKYSSKEAVTLTTQSLLREVL